MKLTYTVGCFGPVSSVQECRELYATCGDGDDVVVTTAAGTITYDPDCPCFEQGSNVPPVTPVTDAATDAPTSLPTTTAPSPQPTANPTVAPTYTPTRAPTRMPTTAMPTQQPTRQPTIPSSWGVCRELVWGPGGTEVTAPPLVQTAGGARPR